MFITLFFSLPSIWNSNFRSIWVMRPFWNLAHRLYPVPDKLTNRFIDSSSSPRPWAMDHLCLPNECLLLSVIYFPSVLFIWIQLNVFPTVRGILIVICCAIHRMRLPACAVTVSAEMVVDYTRLLCLFRHRLLRHKLVLSFKLWSELAHTHTHHLNSYPSSFFTAICLCLSLIFPLIPFARHTVSCLHDPISPTQQDWLPFFLSCPALSPPSRPRLRLRASVPPVCFEVNGHAICCEYKIECKYNTTRLASVAFTSPRLFRYQPL